MIKKILFAGMVSLFLILSSVQINNVVAHDNGNNMSNYIQPNNELVKKVVQEKISASMSMLKKAEILYNYVTNNIDYRRDQKVWGVRDYWQYPSTTLKKKTGDCEDQAMLLTSLLRSAGFSRDNVRLVYGKVVNLISGKLKGYHCWVKIKLSTEELSEIPQLYTIDLEELAGKNITLHTNDGDISLTVDENKLHQYSVLGVGDRDGWIPLDTSFDPAMPFPMWVIFGYYTYYIVREKAQPIETYIDPLPPTKVILSMEKEEYQAGETIIFRVTNTGEENITFPNTAPYTIYRVAKAGFYEVLEPVYTPVGLEMLVSLKGGESVNFSWDQRDNNGKQVADGEYMIVIHYYENDEIRQLSKTFKIISPAWEWQYYNFSVNKYAKIKSKVYAPKEMEIEKEYEIPIYFSRENIIWIAGNAIEDNTPLDVNIFVGLGKTLNRTICRILIEIADGSEWQIDIPLKERNNVVGKIVLGVPPIIDSGKNEYVQMLTFQIPPYHYVTDIPSDWDGPYKIVIKITRSSSQTQPPYTPILTSQGVLHNITFDKIKIIDTPFTVNISSPNNVSLKMGILLGSTISPYYIKKENDTYCLFNNEYKIKIETPFIINNSKLFLTPVLTTFGVSPPSINIAPETIVAKEKLKSVKSITLKMEDFTPVYEIKGYKKEKLLGIFSVKEPITLKVNAVTGEKISEKEPWWGFLT